MILDASKFENKSTLLKYIYANKSKIITAKKSIIKESRSIITDSTPKMLNVNKAFNLKELDEDTENVITRRLVINTTNIFDSHKDLHLPKMWNKSLKENFRRQHLREHKGGLENVISSDSDLQAYTIDTTFNELGFDLKGNTQALVYESKIRKERNEFMFNQYKNNWIKEHSVGMIYVKMEVCLDDNDSKDEYANYKKYIEMGVNPEAIEKDGYFFAILEAKEREGSAVREGSNYVTPILDIEPLKDTHKTEPLKDTHTKQLLTNLLTN